MPQANQTEQATPRRRQKAREKGQVARSRDLIGAASGMAATFVLFALMSTFPFAWRGFFHDCLAGAVSGDLRMDALPPFLSHSGLFVATAAVLAYLAVGCLRRDWTALIVLPGRSARGMLGFAAGRVFEVAWKSALVLLLWAVLDYLFERRHLSTELKMSRQEVADEYKESEGNPVIKGRIRRLQRQLRRRRMLEDTKRAAVVITNPTEYAIAIEYRPDMPAPVVVAKGRNLLAAQIKEIARWENIPMAENPPIAHVLYRTVEVGQSVPAKLYAVLAEILAAIYRAQARALAAAATAAGRRP